MLLSTVVAYKNELYLLQPTFLETFQMRLNNSFGLKMWTLGDEVQQISLYNEPLTFDETQKEQCILSLCLKGSSVSARKYTLNSLQYTSLAKRATPYRF